MKYELVVSTAKFELIEAHWAEVLAYYLCPASSVLDIDRRWLADIKARHTLN